MNKFSDSLFAYISELLNQIAFEYFTMATEAQTKEEVLQTMSQTYNQYLLPVTKLREEMEGADIARKYLAKTGKLDPTVLSQEEMAKLIRWINLKHYNASATKEDLESLDDGKDIENIC